MNTKALLNKYPTLEYKFFKENDTYILRDIFVRIKIKEYIKNNISVYEYNRIGEEFENKLENFSFNLYDDVDQHWILMLMNNLLDPRFDVGVDNAMLSNILSEKYKGFAYEIKEQDGFILKGMNILADCPTTERNGKHVCYVTEINIPNNYLVCNNNFLELNKKYTAKKIDEQTGNIIEGNVIVDNKMLYINAPHHYLNTKTNTIIDRDIFFTLEKSERQVVSNYNYEFFGNENKRRIKTLNKKFISNIQSEVTKIIKQEKV